MCATARGNHAHVCDNAGMADELNDLIRRNHAWSERVRAEDPEFFSRLSQQQAPEFLWIGCSESRVPANQIIDMAPGEVFVHRNVANVVVHTDLNCLSVIQFAVDVLKVKHILVVGHYGCGGVYAALTNLRLGLVDNWTRHVRDVRDKHYDLLKGLSPQWRHDALCELNAIEQVLNVAQSTVMQDAWARGQKVQIHSWCYSLQNGLITNLHMTVPDVSGLDKAYREAVAMVAARERG